MRSFAALAAIVPFVAAHGFIKSPAPRQPGTAFETACGEQPFYQQSSDINGNVQGIMQVTGDDLTADCNLWLCKGFQFADNKDNVESYALGQTVDFQITIAAPHTGYANVSVVKTSTNSLIGEPLIEFTNYASNNGIDANNTAFSVTLPNSLGGDCTTAGDCVLQWFWDAPDIDQTYESCVDFTVSGSGGGDSPEPSGTTTTVKASSTAEPAVTTKPAVTTAPAVTTEPAFTTPEPTLISTTAVSVIGNSTTTAPAPVQTTDLPDDDDDCTGDDGEDDGEDGDDEDGDGEDDDCAADGDDEDTGDDDEPDDACPADEDDGADDDETDPADDDEPETGDDDADTPDEEFPTSAPGPIFVTLPATTLETVVATEPTTLSTVTRVVTVTAEPVTVTAQPAAGGPCTA